MNKEIENLKLSQYLREWFEKTTNTQWPEPGSLSEFYGVCILSMALLLVAALVIVILALCHMPSPI
jgi:hypothetical protein